MICSKPRFDARAAFGQAQNDHLFVYEPGEGTREEVAFHTRYEQYPEEYNVPLEACLVKVEIDHTVRAIPQPQEE